MVEKEEVLGFFPRVTQFMHENTLALFFTTNRIIVAETAGTGKKLGAQFLLGDVGEALVLGVAKEKGEKLSSLSPESIISSNKKNYDIPYSEISKISLKKPGKVRGGNVTVSTTKGKKRFLIGDTASKVDLGFLPKLSSILEDKLTIE